MPDTPLTDPRTLNKNPQKFAELLQSAALGHVLWTPTLVSQSGAVGDCGYITGGRFIKLFNVFESNDLGFPHLSRHGRDVHVMHKENLDDVLSSSQIQSISLSTNFQAGPIDIPPFMQLQLRAGIRASQEDVAFLAYYGRHRTITEFDKLRLLETYLVVHGPAIAETFGQEYPVTVDHLVIIHGTTSSASWLGGISSARAFQIGGDLSFGSTGGSLELANVSTGGWLFTYGDSYFAEESPEYCIVAKMVRCKRRRLRDKVQTAVGAISKTLFRATSPLPGADASPASATGDLIANPSAPQHETRSGTSESMDSHSHDDPEDDSHPLATLQYDLLDSVLDFVLDSLEMVDCVVGNWGIIERCLKDYGDFPEDWQSMDLLDIRVEQEIFQETIVARLVSIHPRDTAIVLVGDSQKEEVDDISIADTPTVVDVDEDDLRRKFVIEYTHKALASSRGPYDSLVSLRHEDTHFNFPGLPGGGIRSRSHERLQLEQQIELLSAERRLLYGQIAASGLPSHPEYFKQKFQEGWNRRTDARTKLICASNRAGNALCAWHDSRRERRVYPPRMAPAGILNCGCTEEEALFEESLARNGVGSYHTSGDQVRMDPGLRRPLLDLLKRRYGYKDGDFELNTLEGTWYEGESHVEWEERLRTSRRAS